MLVVSPSSPPRSGSVIVWVNFSEEWEELEGEEPSSPMDRTPIHRMGDW